ncbi:hypothetical protein HPB49_005214 [Dermacentor silvarum]|uniref:Uncharacterized protein n=1 Tax=Dermacentor silvarum TaxID=543639 RepID=A0ACB8DW59_DERSI|nr:hypothetical protein HPB49_005214 [Dermacentor silvarum]
MEATTVFAEARGADSSESPNGARMLATMIMLTAKTPCMLYSTSEEDLSDSFSCPFSAWDAEPATCRFCQQQFHGQGRARQTASSRQPTTALVAITRFRDQPCHGHAESKTLRFCYSDAAAYTHKAAHLRKILYPQMVPVTGLAHALHRICEELRKHFKDVNKPSAKSV